MRKTAQAIVFTVILSGLPATAAACGTCTFSVFAYGNPLIVLLCSGISIWFLAVMLAAAAEKELRLSPYLSCHLVKTVVYFLLAWIIAWIALGPFPFAVLGFLACCTTIKACLPKVRKNITPFSRIGLTVTSVVAFFSFLAWADVNDQTLLNRSDADFILQWGGYRSNAVLHQLIAEKDTVQLRRILAETKNEYLAEEVAEALATLNEEMAEQPEDTQ